jgi:predicted ArsR family transcriptional regulator
MTAPDRDGTSPDLTRMRAVAHPTRARILNLLREHPSLTATECASMLHLTPKTCSYHLQTLAAGGLIEDIPTAGRNRPWRLAGNTGTAPAPAATARSRTPAEVRRRREETLLDDAAVALASAPATWADAAAIHTRIATMSPEQVRAWCEEMERVTTRHVRKAGTTMLSDATGARVPVHLMFCGFPDPHGG